MGASQDVDFGDLGPVGKILFSIVDGLMIAVLNKVMLEFLGAAEQFDRSSSVWGVDFIALIGIEWIVIIFALNVMSVIVAYGILNWFGVILYVVGWLYMASRIEVIGLGLTPLLVGVLILLAYEYFSAEVSGGGYR